MTRFRTFAPFAGLTALLAASLFSAAPACAQTVTVTDLSPAGSYTAYGAGVSGGTQVGTLGALYDYGHAVLWRGTATSLVDLTPAGVAKAQALGVSGDTQVGSILDADGVPRAILWHGTADSAVSIDPITDSTFNGSVALAVSGDTQVGYSVRYEPGFFYPVPQHALLWHGTAGSVVDLNPAGFAESIAYGVDGDTQVGYGGYADTALLWHGTAGSAVSLNPPGSSARAYGVSGGVEVGFVKFPSDPAANHAVLWRGTADSVVDLHRTGFVNSIARAASGDVQVGLGQPHATASDYNYHALLWHGTAASMLDLSIYLPSDFQGGTSEATGVSGSGNAYDVVGYATGNGTGITHPFLWHVALGTAAPPRIVSLLPASRTEGRGAFLLAVIGNGFTSKSVVQWNGQTQATTFVSSARLTAQIPASLIARAGTAKITVLTPGVGTSNAHAETIMARPVITGLSPGSVKAGSDAFRLVVTGTAFRPQSFYAPTVVKWNGQELDTNVISGTELTAQVPASLVAHAGTAQVTVTTPQVATTTFTTFTITP